MSERIIIVLAIVLGVIFAFAALLEVAYAQMLRDNDRLRREIALVLLKSTIPSRGARDDERVAHHPARRPSRGDPRV